jgi:hypothetical protein
MDGVPQGMYLSPPFSLARISSSCSSSLSSVSLPGVETLLKGSFHKILYLRFISSLSPFVCLPTIISYTSKSLGSYTCDPEWLKKKTMVKYLTFVTLSKEIIAAYRETEACYIGVRLL